MIVDVKIRIVREGKSDTYPWESSCHQYSIDGKEWYNAYGTPFEKFFTSDFIEKAYSAKLKKYETKIFEP